MMRIGSQTETLISDVNVPSCVFPDRHSDETLQAASKPTSGLLALIRAPPCLPTNILGQQGDKCDSQN